MLKSERIALFTLSILDCLWQTVLNCPQNEEHFLENEGFYVIMDFIDKCHLMHRKVALSILTVLIGKINNQNLNIRENYLKDMNILRMIIATNGQITN